MTSADAYVIPPNLATHLGRIAQVLRPNLTDQRFERLATVVSRRSRAILPVFQSTAHCHNISAVLRSVEACGFQDAFFVYENPVYVGGHIRDTVERGSSNWLTLRAAPDVAAVKRFLGAAGYKVLLVTKPDFALTGSHFRRDVPEFSNCDLPTPAFAEGFLRHKVALVFGNERFGVSAEWNECADGYLAVEMRGFVESLNLSVCAGILLHGLRQAREAAGLPGITAQEKEILLDLWTLRSCLSAYDILGRSHPELMNYFRHLRDGRFFVPFGELNGGPDCG